MQPGLSVRLFRSLDVDGILFHVYLFFREMKFYIMAMLKGTFSQHSEDKFILQYFQGKSGVFIDIGANHPFIISNTYLLYRKGWSGVTVEPIPYLYKRLKKYRPRDIALNKAVSDKIGSLMFYQMIPSVLSTFDNNKADELMNEGNLLRHEHSIKVTTLAQLYREHLAGKEVDVLSIDTEGLDMEVLKGNDWSAMSPKLIICEVSGTKDTVISEYLQLKGYKIIKELGCNRIYEKQS